MRDTGYWILDERRTWPARAIPSIQDLASSISWHRRLTFAAVYQVKVTPRVMTVRRKDGYSGTRRCFDLSTPNFPLLLGWELFTLIRDEPNKLDWRAH